MSGWVGEQVLRGGGGLGRDGFDFGMFFVFFFFRVRKDVFRSLEFFSVSRLVNKS
jgi:hypothetical protein